MGALRSAGGEERLAADEGLLEEEGDVGEAAARRAVGGQEGGVGAVHAQLAAGRLQVLEGAGEVDRVRRVQDAARGEDLEVGVEVELAWEAQGLEAGLGAVAEGA